MLDWKKRESYGISTGYVREMFEQHLPLLKPFTHRRFTHFTGNVAQFCEIHDKYVEPHKFFSIHLELSKQFYIFAIVKHNYKLMENYLISEAIGDIAGSAYEGRMHRIKDYDKVKMFSSRAHFTDDTVLTFACAEAFIDHLDMAKNLWKCANEHRHAGFYESV